MNVLAILLYLICFFGGSMFGIILMCLMTAGRENDTIKPKNGKWLSNGNDYTCSNCKYTFDSSFYNFTHVCPNCGSKNEFPRDVSDERD